MKDLFHALLMSTNTEKWTSVSFPRGPINLIEPASCDQVGFPGGDRHMATQVNCRNNIRKVKVTREKKVKPPQAHSTTETLEKLKGLELLWEMIETD